MLPPAAVGRTFVAPAQYEELCEIQHTLLIGPRGSGKTTLLKMLTPDAIAAWQEKQGREYSPLPYMAVYIPADILWSQQIESMTRAGAGLDEAFLLSRAAVGTNVFYAIANAMEIQLKRAGNAKLEEELSLEIAREWHLDEVFPRFQGIRRALRTRLSQLSVVTSKASAAHGPTVPESIPDFAHIDFLIAAGNACDVFADLTGLPEARRWALCFDELEICPPWLYTRLLSLLRSTDQRFLFKLSASPLQAPAPNELAAAEPQEGEDFRIVKLWYSGATEARDFCRRLAAFRIAELVGSDLDPERVFGRSAFGSEDAERTGGDRTYRHGSRFWAELKKAYQTDPSLRKLLRQHGVDLREDSNPSAALRDSLLRKLKPILLIRNEYRRASESGREGGILRSRKRTSLYTGADAIYAVSDGNPRRLVGMLQELVPHIVPGHRVSLAVQAAAVRRLASRFNALMRVLPGSAIDFANRQLGVGDLLDAIGNYFFERLVRGPFPLDPPGSITVDRRANAAVLRLLEVAVLQGALVHVESNEDHLPTGIRGKRFRLSFSLAPHYRLPLRVYDSVELSACLEAPTSHLGAFQAELFGDE
jgi:hypothetical protein